MTAALPILLALGAIVAVHGIATAVRDVVPRGVRVRVRRWDAGVVGAVTDAPLPRILPEPVLCGDCGPSVVTSAGRCAFCGGRSWARLYSHTARRRAGELPS